MQGTWFCNGTSITVSGGRATQQGMSPQQLFPVERMLAGKKIITVAHHIDGAEVIFHVRASSAGQIAWMNQGGEHVRVWVKGRQQQHEHHLSKRGVSCGADALPVACMLKQHGSVTAPGGPCARIFRVPMPDV